MRKFALAATAVAALSVGLQTPAFAAAPDAPTDLTVDWQAGKVHLTWKDNGEANYILAEYDGGTPGTVLQTTAAEGNDVTLSVPLRQAERVRLLVRSENADGVSADAATPAFDTLRPSAPGLKDANLATNLTTNLSWVPGSIISDNTPNDPLDLPGNGTVQATVTGPGGTKSYPFAADATSGSVPAQARPAAIKLSQVNEWGTSPQDVKTVKLGTLGASTTVPASALFSNRLAIKSTLDLFTSAGREERASGIPVQLQARAKTTDAWKTYGRYSGNTTAAFDTGIASLGNRQYRLWVPARKVVSGNIIALTPAASTGAKSSKTYVKFGPGGFNPSTVRVGGRSTLSVKILPAVTVKARPQGWDGRHWIDLGIDVPITKGSYVERGDIETERYTLRLRFVVPTVVVNGLTVLANTSPAYNLTVK
ncbi:hypothetical protein GCM10009745_61280 [Kribbella yunnanensis]|uniref:Fibronectin type III domain-containing protein n=1 Tax=Kribbella yunnanensis TaxID=190194 RepID=A0ABN2IHX0_9ACTN